MRWKQIASRLVSGLPLVVAHNKVNLQGLALARTKMVAQISNRRQSHFAKLTFRPLRVVFHEVFCGTGNGYELLRNS
jgi:hypothetical protein